MKQVKAATLSTAPVSQNGNSTQANNLYISVNTFDVAGKTIGERIVDMYHFGTRGWLQNHHWWAMHNGHTVECNVANDKEIGAYLANAKVALAEKFNAPNAAAAIIGATAQTPDAGVELPIAAAA